MSRAIDLAPDDANLHYADVMLRWSHAMDARILTPARKATEWDPDNPIYHAAFAYFACVFGDRDEAQRQIQVAEGHEPDDFWALIFLAQAFGYCGNIEKANAYFDRAGSLRHDAIAEDNRAQRLWSAARKTSGNDRQRLLKACVNASGIAVQRDPN